MMRFARAAILPLMLMIMASVAIADPILVTKNLAVRRTKTNGGNDPTWVSSGTGTAGYVDSVLFSNNNLATVQEIDTTAAFVLEGLAPVRCAPGIATASATADSAWAMRFTVNGNASLGSTTSLDTLLSVKVQGSFDGGASWASGVARTVVEGTSANSVGMWYTVLLPYGLLPASTPTNANICNAPILRIIFSCASGSGQFHAKASYFVPSDLIGRLPNVRIGGS